MIFLVPQLWRKKICSDNILSPICDNSNDASDVLNPPTESIPFEISMEIVEWMNVMQGMEKSIHMITC